MEKKVRDVKEDGEKMGGVVAGGEKDGEDEMRDVRVGGEKIEGV